MKKTIAAGGASLLGLAAVGFGAAPAQAADVTIDCDDINDHEVSVTPASNWYMDCIPQYAVSSVDFTIESDVPFPDGFKPLDDPAVSSTSTVGSVGDTYAGSASAISGFSSLQEGTFDSSSQSYYGNLILPISSVGPATAEQLTTAGCPTSSPGYVVNYSPSTVSFSQTVDGVEWRYDVVTAPGPLYFAPDFGGDSGWCSAGNGGSNSSSFEVEFQATTWDGFGSSDVEESLWPFFGDGKTLPDVSRYVAPPPEPDPIPAALPATGLDPTVPLGVAALFLALGVTGGYLKRRRA